MKNARNLGLRLDQQTTDRLTAFENATKIEGVTLARAALEAALDAYQSTGKIAFPLCFQVAQTENAELALLAEAPTPYSANGKQNRAG